MRKLRTLAQHERLLILRTLEYTSHNRSEAARALGISIRCLRNKILLYRSQGDPLPFVPRGFPKGYKSAHCACQLAKLGKHKIACWSARKRPDPEQA